MTDETPDTTPPPDPVVQAAAFTTKAAELSRVLGDAADRYEQERPFWEAETLLDLTRSAVGTFWYYLHHPEETAKPEAHTEGALGRRVPDPDAPPVDGPSWNAPEVELQYPVAFNWEGDGFIVRSFATEEIGGDPETWANLKEDTLRVLRTLHVFDLVTRGGRTRTDGTTHEQAIPADLLQRFPSLASAAGTIQTTSRWEGQEAAPEFVLEPDAKAALEARYRPFLLSVSSLASVSHEYVLRAMAIPTNHETWSRLPFETRRRFLWTVLDQAVSVDHEEASLENLPDLLRVKGHVQETPFTATLRVAFHPLVLDTREPRRAFFPVTLSVIYAGEIPLADWPDETREKLWGAFFRTLDGGLDAIRRSAESSAPSPAPAPSPSPEPTPPSALQYAGPPPIERKVFPLAFGLTKVDRDVLDLAGSVHKVRFVSRWSSLKSWPELVNEEIATILENVGDAAFSPIKNGRAPLLLRRNTRTGETVVRLSEEAERRLKIQKGLSSNGYRYVDPLNGKEYHSIVCEFRGGYLEVGRSWFGLAGPWVDEWRKGVQKEARDREKQASLFDELDDEARTRINRARLLDDSHRLMEAVLGQVGKQRQNPVIVSAEAFRVLLKLTDDPHWKGRLEGGLDALRACEFRFRSFGTGQLIKGYGAFLSGWQYHGAGPGAHGDGVYLLYVHEPFLGCLMIFEKETRKIGGDHVTTFDFAKQLSEEDKAKVGWGYDRKARARRIAVARFVEFDAGRPFYSASAGLTPTQEALHRVVDEELTRRGSTVSKVLGAYDTRRAEQVPRQAHDASRPRIYNSAFCPLLPEGRRYFAALGNFIRNAEAGWTLYGTPRRESKTGGPHGSGLLYRMGYALPLGGGSQARARADVVKKALEDIQAVITEYLGGVVAAYHAGHWLTLEEAAKLPDEDLGRRTRWFLFVPETYHADRREKFEKVMGYTVTEDPAEAQRAAFRETGDALALRERLRAARLDRGLSQAAVGALFGVSQRTVGFWEIGPEPHEDGKVRGKPIPLELVPFLERWLSGGGPPTVEELEGRKATRTGVRKSLIEPPADENR